MLCCASQCFVVQVVNVINRTDTLLVVDVGDTNALSTGNIQARVTHISNGNSGAFVTIGQIVSGITAPSVEVGYSVVKTNVSPLQVLINGQTFGTAALDVRVYLTPFNAAAPALTNTILTLASTQMQIEISDACDQGIGPVSAMITVQGVKATTKVVMTLAASAFTVANTNANYARASTGSRIEVHGRNFGSVAENIRVVLDPVLQYSQILSCSDSVVVVDVGDFANEFHVPLKATVLTNQLDCYNSAHAYPVIGLIYQLGATCKKILTSCDGCMTGSWTATSSQASDISCPAIACAPDPGSIEIPYKTHNDDNYRSGCVDMTRCVHNLNDGVTVFAPDKDWLVNAPRTNSWVILDTGVENTICPTRFVFWNQNQFSSNSRDVSKVKILASSSLLSDFVPIKDEAAIAASSSADPNPAVTVDITNCLVRQYWKVILTEFHTSGDGNLGGLMELRMFGVTSPQVIGQIVHPINRPIVNASTMTLSSVATSLIIHGQHFGTESKDVQVYLAPSGSGMVPNSVVAWTNLAGVTTNSNNGLRKTASASWTTGAGTSIKTFASTSTVQGISFVYPGHSTTSTCGTEFSTLLGLNHVSASPQPGVGMAFGLMFCGPNCASSSAYSVHVYEFGLDKGVKATWAIGDTFHVSISPAGQVQYSKNHFVVYSSQTSPNFPLSADVAMYCQDQEVNEIRWHGSTLFTLTGNVIAGSVKDSSLTISLDGLADEHRGALNVIVAVKGIKSETRQIADIVPVRPVIGVVCHILGSSPSSTCDSDGDGDFADACAEDTLCTKHGANNGGCGSGGVCRGTSFGVSQSSMGNRIEIRGLRFGADRSKLTVVFTPRIAATSKVVWCDDTSLVVETDSTSSALLGQFAATVLRKDYASSHTVPIGTILTPMVAPGVTPSYSTLASSATQLVINGNGFGTEINNVRVRRSLLFVV